MRPWLACSLGALLLCSCESAFSGLVRPNPDDCTVSPCPERQQCNQRTHRCEPTANPDGGAADGMSSEKCLQNDPRLMVRFNKSGTTNAQVSVKVSSDGQQQTCTLPCSVSVCPQSKLSARAVTPDQTCLTGWEILHCMEGGDCPSIQVTSAQLEVAITQTAQINALLATCAIRPVNNGSAETLIDVSGAGNALYVAGEKGGLRRWDGSALTPVTVGATNLQAMSFHAPDQGLLVGGTTYFQMTGFNASTKTTLPLTNANVRSVALTSKGLGWMVGSGALGAALALRWDGAQATDDSPKNKAALEAVSGAGTEFWAVGPGGVFQNTGTGWVDQTALADKSHLMHAVFVSRWGEVWLAGEKGGVLRGSEKGFTLMKEIVTVALRDVWGSSPEDVWLVGDKDASGGVILRWNGASFSRLSLPGTGSFYGIWGRGPADVWFVGEGGMVYRYSPL
jgi:hypothetical protein